MSTKLKLVLASQSPYRAQILRQAGVNFEAKPAAIDERAVEEPLLAVDCDVTDIPLILAQAKAMDVSENISDAIVIGADQTLTFDNQLLHKPENMEEARRRLLALSGKSHQLTSAVALAKNGEILWHYTDTAIITFRKLSPQFVGRYLASVGEAALTSVGAYQIEGEGVQLFDKIDGDFFSIMGLPLISLLKKLRELDVIDG